MKLKRNVVMLPTNEKAIIDKGNIVLYKKLSPLHDDDIDKPVGSLLTSVRTVPNSEWWEKQHLYITSDEEIKEGDYVIDKAGVFGPYERTDSLIGNSKKIIATTDKSLTISEIIYPEEFVHAMPSPSDGFIKKFIERYNAGNPITQVMVEYEDDKTCTACGAYQMKENLTCHYPAGRGCCGGALAHKLKVDKNNCITITAVKDSWTRKEVMQLCFQAFIQHKVVDGKITPSDAEELYEPFNKWIEENL